MSKKTIRGKTTKKYPSIRAMLVMVSLLAVSAAGIAAYKSNWNKTHDLSVIGNGISTIVQIHDPSCRLCRSLMASTEQALDRMDGQIQYRIADIHTPEGKLIQNRHEVPHVTLLLFDPAGKLVRTLTGVKSADTLHHVFKSFMGKRES